MIRPGQLDHPQIVQDGGADPGADDVLQAMLRDIGRTAMLSPAEERWLARRLCISSHRYRREMLRPIVVTQALKDLIQQAVEGATRVDRVLAVAVGTDKEHLLSMASLHLGTIQGMLDRREHQESRSPILFSMAETRRVYRLLDEIGLQTSRIEQAYETCGLDADRVHVARQKYFGYRNRMVSANLRLVVSVAKKYQRSGVPLVDLFQEGSRGLLRAAEKYDPTRGFKFSTYAVWWIRQSVCKASAERGRMIRIGEHTLNQMRRLTDEASQSLNVDAQHLSFEQLPRRLGEHPNRREERRKAFYAMKDVTSLDQPLKSEGESTFAQGLTSAESSADELLLASDQRDYLLRAMQHLSTREQLVVSLLFGLEDGCSHSLSEVGRTLNVSRERVRQIEKGGLQKLRKAFEELSLVPDKLLN